MRLQQEQGTAKNGLVLIKSKISAPHVAWRVLKILLFLIVSHVIALILFLIPLIGLIPSIAVFLVSWVLILLWVVLLLIYCFGHTVITTDGIYGRDKRNKAFDLPFDCIQKFERSGTKIIIEADVINKHGDVRRMEYVIPMINSVEFEEQYKNR